MSFIDFTNLSYDLVLFTLKDPLGYRVEYIGGEGDGFYAPYVASMRIIPDKSKPSATLQVRMSTVDFNMTLQEAEGPKRKRDFINKFFYALLSVMAEDGPVEFLNHVARGVGEEALLPLTLSAISVCWNETRADFSFSDSLTATSSSNDNFAKEQCAMALIGYVVMAAFSDGKYQPYDPNFIKTMDPILSYHLAISLQKLERERYGENQTSSKISLISPI